MLLFVFLQKHTACSVINNCLICFLIYRILLKLYILLIANFCVETLHEIDIFMLGNDLCGEFIAAVYHEF